MFASVTKKLLRLRPTEVLTDQLESSINEAPPLPAGVTSSEKAVYVWTGLLFIHSGGLSLSLRD